MWIYKDKVIQSIDDFPEGSFGFVYELEHVPTGRKYIGKKVLFFNKTLPPLKGSKRKRKIVKESDWKDYYGSNKDLKNLVNSTERENWKRVILQIVPNKKLLTYYETKFLFINEVLEGSEHYYNDNILGKFFRKDFYD